MRRFLALLILVPVTAVLVLLAVANRESVTLSLDPFSPEAPAWSVALPLFVVILGAMIVGALIGGIAAWLRQGGYRHEARARRTVVARLEAEAERLRRSAEPDRLSLPAVRTR
jgi:uncharacterized integral membrane protein